MAVDAFNKAQNDVAVEYVSLVQSSDSVEFMTKLDVLMAGGEVVDVFMSGNEEQMLERASRGVVEPLNAFFTKEGTKPEDEYFKTINLDGKVYGLSGSASQLITVFNKDHLQAAGLPIPEMGWTWDDFREYAKKLTTKDHYGAYFHTWGEYPNTIAYNELPNPQLTADKKPAFEHPSFEYFFNLRRAMEKEDKSVEPYADVLAGNYHVLQQFFAGKASMLVTGNFAIRAALNQEKFPHKFQSVYAPVPRSVGSTELGLTNQSIGGLGVGAKSKNKEAAYKFIRWITTEGMSYINDIPNWKKVDGKAVLEKYFGGNKDLIDTESLAKTIFDPRIKSPAGSFVVPYNAELKTLVENKFGSFMLDNRSFKDVQKELIAETEKIIKSHQ